jgi:hypothetical protein
MVAGRNATPPIVMGKKKPQKKPKKPVNHQHSGESPPPSNDNAVSEDIEGENVDEEMSVNQAPITGAGSESTAAKEDEKVLEIDATNENKNALNVDAVASDISISRDSSLDSLKERNTGEAGEEEKNAAAVMIQRNWRGHHVRMQYANKEVAAYMIGGNAQEVRDEQRQEEVIEAFKGAERPGEREKSVQSEISKVNDGEVAALSQEEQENAAAVMIQRNWRGHHVRVQYANKEVAAYMIGGNAQEVRDEQRQEEVIEAFKGAERPEEGAPSVESPLPEEKENEATPESEKEQANAETNPDAKVPELGDITSLSQEEIAKQSIWELAGLTPPVANDAGVLELLVEIEEKAVVPETVDEAAGMFDNLCMFHASRLIITKLSRESTLMLFLDAQQASNIQWTALRIASRFAQDSSEAAVQLLSASMLAALSAMLEDALQHQRSELLMEASLLIYWLCHWTQSILKVKASSLPQQWREVSKVVETMDNSLLREAVAHAAQALSQNRSSFETFREMIAHLDPAEPTSAQKPVPSIEDFAMLPLASGVESLAHYEKEQHNLSNSPASPKEEHLNPLAHTGAVEEAESLSTPTSRRNSQSVDVTDVRVSMDRNDTPTTAEEKRLLKAQKKAMDDLRKREEKELKEKRKQEEKERKQREKEEKAAKKRSSTLA